MFRASAGARALLLGCLLGALTLAQAQVFGDEEWKEDPAPAPPAFSKDKLIPIEVPTYMSLRFGVDPATIKVGKDGVVSYVVIASQREGGGFNAFFEGIHCASEEYKTYARFNNGTWDVQKKPEWKKIDNRNSIYTKLISRQGMCRDHAPYTTAGQTIDAMRTPVREVN